MQGVVVGKRGVREGGEEGVGLGGREEGACGQKNKKAEQEPP